MKALYAGSFDPFTIGHEYVARRALDMFEGLIIGVGFNESKRSERGVEERIKHIRDIFAGEEKVTVVGYEGLTAEAAKDLGAGALVRGVRNAIDFTKEKELADINLKVFGMPTVMIPSSPELSYVSSSMVRELQHFGMDTEKFLPKGKKGI